MGLQVEDRYQDLYLENPCKGVKICETSILSVILNTKVGNLVDIYCRYRLYYSNIYIWLLKYEIKSKREALCNQAMHYHDHAWKINWHINTNSTYVVIISYYLKEKNEFIP